LQNSPISVKNSKAEKGLLLPLREFFTGIKGFCPPLRRGVRFIVVWSCSLSAFHHVLVSSGCCTARLRDVWRSHPDKAAEILNGRHQQKLFGGTGEAAQFQAGKAELPLHMPEEHLDLAAQNA
jgi:hypothetical protein